MISLVLAMVWTRRGQALTLALLALLAVAAAVASPAYLAAADRAIAAGQIATATPVERGITLSGQQDERGDKANEFQFAAVGAALVDAPGFDYVYSAQFPTVGIEADNETATQLVFRQDTCAHLRIVQGRCVIGIGDVVLGTGTAKRLGLTAGDAITLTYAKYNNDPRDPFFEPDGEPQKLRVAGVYTVPDPADLYWGTHGYFTAQPSRGPGEPVFTNATTIALIDHGRTDMAIDGTAGPAALDIDHLPELRTGLEALRQSTAKLGPAVQVNTGIPFLLDRIDAGRANARLLVPVLAVPLVLLACFSIFLAVAYGAQGRQPELAIVALRGTRWWTRWWLASGESLVAILAGAVLGCVTGQLLIDAVAAARFPGVGVDAGWSSLRYAPVAALAAVGAAVLAQRRQLLSPVATLLRRNPAKSGGPGSFVLEAVIVVLAVVSGVQLALSNGALTGVSLLAPAFVVLALALVVARAVLPAVGRYATRALGAGRLGPALAAFQLSRRPGAQRLFALLVATVAVAGYAACAIDVAARDRAMQSTLGIGADRVLSVEPVYRSQLMDVVRTIDPDGRFAMAAVRLPNSSAGEPLGIAVDARRLAAVAAWPEGGPTPREVVERLRPPAPAPIVLKGQDVSIDATTTGMTAGKELKLQAAVSSAEGLGESLIDLGFLKPGRVTYQLRVPVCRLDCRLNGIELSIPSPVGGVTGSVVINSVGTINPVRVAVPAAELTDLNRWRIGPLATLASDAGGLRIDVAAPDGIPDGIWARPASTPVPLPIAWSGSRPDRVTGLDGDPLPITLTDRLPAVPRLGTHATMVDLDYADRLAVDASAALDPQIWLNAQAPADIADQVAAHGLTIVGDTRSSQIRRQLDQQGPALSLWFYFLAAALSVLLGAGTLVLAAAVDRGRRVEDLTTLRVQGLRRPVAGWATLWTYPMLVAIAAFAGTLTAVAAWGLTGWALPLAGVDPPALPLPGWPRAPAVVATTVVVFLLLAGVAAATGRDLHRRVR